MKANIIIEMASDGGFACYMQEEIPHISLTGYGDSAREAKEDLLQTYEDMKDILAEEGKEIPQLEFVYHYDMKSFFDYFDFLNVSKVAQLAGINPSLMRKYTSGVTMAREPQYRKLQKAVQSFASELQNVAF